MRKVNWQKYSTFGKPQESPGFRLWQTFLTWQRELNLILQPLGLTQPQFSILAVIGWLTRNRTSIKQQDIANFMSMERMHVSQIVRKLEKMGYVERDLSLEDRRVQMIQLSQSGISQLEEALPLVEVADAKFFDT